METFSRFANSREVTELVSATKHLQLVQDNIAKIAGSDAFATCLRSTIDNYVRFSDEYTKQLYGIVLQGQEFVTRPNASLKLSTSLAAPFKLTLNR